MLTLAHVMDGAGIDPHDASVIFHRLSGRFGRDIARLSRTRPAAVEAFQKTYNAPGTASLRKGRTSILSFFRSEPTSTAPFTFLGLFQNVAPILRPRREIAADSEVEWLRETYDELPEFTSAAQGDWEWFDLRRDPAMTNYVGRLSIENPGGRPTIRRGESVRHTPVHALLPPAATP